MLSVYLSSNHKTLVVVPILVEGPGSEARWWDISDRKCLMGLSLQSIFS